MGSDRVRRYGDCGADSGDAMICLRQWNEVANAEKQKACEGGRLFRKETIAAISCRIILIFIINKLVFFDLTINSV